MRRATRIEKPTDSFIEEVYPGIFPCGSHVRFRDGHIGFCRPNEVKVIKIPNIKNVKKIITTDRVTVAVSANSFSILRGGDVYDSSFRDMADAKTDPRDIVDHASLKKFDVSALSTGDVIISKVYSLKYMKYISSIPNSEKISKYSFYIPFGSKFENPIKYVSGSPGGDSCLLTAKNGKVYIIGNLSCGYENDAIAEIPGLEDVKIAFTRSDIGLGVAALKEGDTKIFHCSPKDYHKYYFKRNFTTLVEGVRDVEKGTMYGSICAVVLSDGNVCIFDVVKTLKKEDSLTFIEVHDGATSIALSPYEEDGEEAVGCFITTQRGELILISNVRDEV